MGTYIGRSHIGPASTGTHGGPVPVPSYAASQSLCNYSEILESLRSYLMDTISKCSRMSNCDITSVRQTEDNGILSLNRLEAQCPYSVLTY